MTNDLRAYKATVLDAMARAIETGQPEALENSGPAHARVVLDVILDNAQKRVGVVSGKMDLVAWSPEAFTGFLNKDPQARLRVILDDAPDNVVPAGSALCELCDHDRIEIRTLPRPLSWHLCVADATHVRLEHNIQSAEAAITFGDPNGIGKKASDIFDRYWLKAKPISQTQQ